MFVEIDDCTVYSVWWGSFGLVILYKVISWIYYVGKITFDVVLWVERSHVSNNIALAVFKSFFIPELLTLSQNADMAFDDIIHLQII